jgi:hypothetical protein
MPPPMPASAPIPSDVAAEADRREQQHEPGGLRDDRDGERRQPPRQRTAGEVRRAPHDRRAEGEREGEEAQFRRSTSMAMP